MPVSSETHLPVVILISGTGSNMRRIAELAQRAQLPVDVKAVISDRANAPGLVTAQTMGIATATLNPKDFAERNQFDHALAELVSGFQPRLVILAGFMRILSADFIQRFRHRLINIHPSLLPKYPGLHTHQRALDAGDSEHGASVHMVTEQLDSGPVIIQASVPILPGDDAKILAARVLQQEHRIYPEAVRLFATGRLECNDRGLHLDGQELRAPLRVSSDKPS